MSVLFVPTTGSWLPLSLGPCQLRHDYDLVIFIHQTQPCPSPLPSISLARYVVPRQVQFNRDLVVINECLDGLIRRAKETRQEEDFEALQNRDYANVK